MAAVLGALLPILAGGPASAAPTISNFTPTTGGAGTLVTINGSNFIAGSTVMLSGKPANVSSITATAIKFTVPASATTGQIKVTDSSGSVTAPGNFAVVAGICCSRTVTPAASFPVYGTALDPNSAMRLALWQQGNFVTNLAMATTDPTGGFNLATVALPPEATGGTYELLATTTQKAASLTIVVQAGWLAPTATARGRNAQRFESMLNYDNVDEVDVDWVATADPFGRPIVVNGLVIVRSGADILAFNAATGAKAWSKTLGDGSGLPAAAGNTIYASTGSAIRALSAATGATLWTSTCSGCPAPTAPRYYHVAVADGVVVAAADNAIRAFNATNGAYLWTGTPSGSEAYSDTAPSIVAGTVIIRGVSLLSAFSLTSGARLWETNLGSTRWLTDLDTVATAAGAVFGNTSNNNPAAYSAREGSLVWQRNDLVAFLGSHAVGDGVVLYGTNTTLYALSTTDGSTQWSYPSACQTSTYANGVFYVHCVDGFARALDASTGELLARFGVASRYYDPPVPAGGSLYISTSGGVAALNLAAADK